MIPDEMMISKESELISELHLRTAQQLAQRIGLNHNDPKTLEIVLSSLLNNNDLLLKYGAIFNQQKCDQGCGCQQKQEQQEDIEGTLEIKDGPTDKN